MMGPINVLLSFWEVSSWKSADIYFSTRQGGPFPYWNNLNNEIVYFYLYEEPITFYLTEIEDYISVQSKNDFESLVFIQT